MCTYMCTSGGERGLGQAQGLAEHARADRGIGRDGAGRAWRGP